MADTKISALPAAGTLDGSESVEIVQGGNSKKTLLQAIANLFSGKLAVQSVVSATTVTPTFANDSVTITAQAAALALANPTGTAQDMWGIVIRIKDDGTARAISYGAQYRAVGVTLPTATTVGKTTYLGMIFNSADTKWDVVSVGTEA